MQAMNPATLNLATLLAANAGSRPDHPAIVAGDTVLTHREAHRRVRRLAGWLASRDIRPGMRVALRLPDTPDHLLLHFALAWVGAVIVPLDHRWADEEAARVARAMRTTFVIGTQSGTLDGIAVMAVRESELLDVLPPAYAEGADMPLVLSLSSGTTGRPTGAIVTHGQLYERFVSQWVTMTFHAQDRFLLATPLYFGGGRSFAMSFLAAGATVIFTAANDPDVLIADAARHDASVAFLVPTQVRRLLAHWQGDGPALPGLRLLVTSGSAVHAQERAEMLRRICPHCLDYYASSEGGGIAVLQPDEQLTFAQTVGRPTFRVEVAVVDDAGQPVAPGAVGRLRYRGPGVSRHMIDADGHVVDLAARDGWFEPGDLALRLPSGHIQLAGRAKDVIIRGGVNLYPAEIEAALVALPGVSEAIVAGIADAELGERVGALVTGAALDPETLREALRASLAPYKVPSRIVVVDTLPRTAMNKPDRAQAKALLAG